MSTPEYVLTEADDHCDEAGCNHARYQHKKGTGRCMDGVNQRGWRCDCAAFVEQEDES